MEQLRQLQGHCFILIFWAARSETEDLAIFHVFLPIAPTILLKQLPVSLVANYFSGLICVRGTDSWIDFRIDYCLGNDMLPIVNE